MLFVAIVFSTVSSTARYFVNGALVGSIFVPICATCHLRLVQIFYKEFRKDLDEVEK
jgi:hypothetical protein